MKTYKVLIAEIEEHIRETDYPGSSLTCGVYPVNITNEYLFWYYPAEKCMMVTSIKTKKKIIIKKVYNIEQAIKISNEIERNRITWFSKRMAGQARHRLKR